MADIVYDAKTTEVSYRLLHMKIRAIQITRVSWTPPPPPAVPETTCTAFLRPIPSDCFLGNGAPQTPSVHHQPPNIYQLITYVRVCVPACEKIT
ncbi:hypothetical protein GBAR_LOCUS551, partial [Geodia barretti]